MNKSLCVRADRLRKWEVRGRVRSVEREEGAELIAEKGENEAILETLSRCSTLTLIYIYIYINNDFFFFFNKDKARILLFLFNSKRDLTHQCLKQLTI